MAVPHRNALNASQEDALRANHAAMLHEHLFRSILRLPTNPFSWPSTIATKDIRGELFQDITPSRAPPAPHRPGNMAHFTYTRLENGHYRIQHWRANARVPDEGPFDVLPSLPPNYLDLPEKEKACYSIEHPLRRIRFDRHDRHDIPLTRRAPTPSVMCCRQLESAFPVLFFVGPPRAFSFKIAANKLDKPRIYFAYDSREALY